MRTWNSGILAVSAAVIVASLVSCGSDSGRAPATTGVPYITVDQAAGSESIVLRTPAGQTVRIQDGSASVIEIADTSGNTITLKPDGIVIKSASKVSVQAATTVDVSAGQVNVTAGMSKFSGVVQADTVIANSVVANSYTPGAGNTW
jgi:hypothetical protein